MMKMHQQRNYLSASTLLAEYDLPLAAGEHMRSAILRTLSTLSTEELLGFLQPHEIELTIQYTLERLPRKTLVSELLRKSKVTPHLSQLQDTQKQHHEQEDPETNTTLNDITLHENEPVALDEVHPVPLLVPVPTDPPDDKIAENEVVLKEPTYVFKKYRNVTLAKRHVYANRSTFATTILRKCDPFPEICSKKTCTLCASLLLSMPLTLCEKTCKGFRCHGGIGAHPPARQLHYFGLLHKRDRYFHVLCPGAGTIHAPGVVEYMYNIIHDDEVLDIPSHVLMSLKEVRTFMLKCMESQAVSYESDCSETPQDVVCKRKTSTTGSVSTSSRISEQRGAKKSRK